MEIGPIGLFAVPLFFLILLGALAIAFMRVGLVVASVVALARRPSRADTRLLRMLGATSLLVALGSSAVGAAAYLGLPELHALNAAQAALSGLLLLWPSRAASTTVA